MISESSKNMDSEAKLSWGERLGYGSGQFSMNMVNGVLGSFLLVYFTNVSFTDAAVVSTIMAISRIFDGISDLVMGNIVDRTNSKMGKARVWMLRMCIPFALSTVLLFSIPSAMTGAVRYVYVFIMYNLVNTVFYTAMAVPYSSLNYLVTRDRYERGLLGNINQIFSTVANILLNTFFIKAVTLLGNGNMYTQRGWTIALIIIGLVVVAGSLICVFTTKERVKDVNVKQEKDPTNPVLAIKALFRNKYWIILTICMFLIFFVIVMYSSACIFYVQYILKDMGLYSWIQNAISVMQFATMFITPFIMKKFGKHKVYQLGIILMIIGFTAFAFSGTNVVCAVIFNALKGIGLGCAGGMAFGMVSDTIDYGEWKTGVRAVGMGNAGISAAQKLGLGLGTAVMGWILSGAGFDGKLQAQSQEALNAISFCYNWIPVILISVCFVLMLFYHLDEEFPKILKELKEKESEQN